MTIFLVLPQIVLFVLGAGILTLLKAVFGIRRTNPYFFAAAAYTAGELAVVLYLALSSMITGLFRWPGLWILTGLSALFLLFRAVRLNGKRELVKTKLRELANPAFLVPAVLILIMVFPNIKVSFYDSFTQWDPKAIWFFHGKAFFFDNAIDPVFLKNPAYLMTHPSYPVFIPLMSVFHAHFLGSWSEILSKSFIYFHWLSALLLLYFVWKVLRVPSVIALTAIGFIQYVYAPYAVWGLGDSLWALAFITGMSLCLHALEAGDGRAARFHLALGALSISMAANTKKEGIAGAIVFWILFLLAVFLTKRKLLKSAFSAAAATAGLSAVWLIFVAVAGIPSIGMISPLGFLKWDMPGLLERAAFIFRLPFQAKLLIPWVFYFAVSALAFSMIYILVRIRKFRDFISSWTIMGTFWGMLIVYFFLYLGTSAKLEWHLRTSLERVLVVNVMLSLMSFVFLTRLPEGIKAGSRRAFSTVVDPDASEPERPEAPRT